MHRTRTRTTRDPRVLTLGPPAECDGKTQVEIGWIGSGGGFSHVFTGPTFQNTLPAGSTAIPADQRGVPDIALQASSHTGPLVYLTLPPDGNSGLICSGSPCRTGWYDIGGTSLSSPEWAGLVAIADQIKGADVGFMNQKLYNLAANPATYASDFFDVTTGNNTDSARRAGLPRHDRLGSGDRARDAQRGEPAARPGRSLRLTQCAPGPVPCGPGPGRRVRPA